MVKHPTRSSWEKFYNRTRRLAGGHYDLRLKHAQSTWQRQMIFITTLLRNLIPPIFFTLNTFLDARLNGMEQKFKVCLMMFLVRYISAWETLQIKLGRVSSRA